MQHLQHDNINPDARATTRAAQILRNAYSIGECDGYNQQPNNLHKHRYTRAARSAYINGYAIGSDLSDNNNQGNTK